MSLPASNLDLIVLVADDDQLASFQELLLRHQALQIRPIKFEVIVHDEHDPGILNRPESLLRPYLQDVARALVVFDRVGSGSEATDAHELEEQVEGLLERNGWVRETGAADDQWSQRRCAAIVIDPELENWVWSDSPNVANVLGWKNERPQMEEFLQRKCLWNLGEPKPSDPKRAMETALHKKKLPLSPSNFQELAKRVSFRRCADPAFLRLLQILRAWFSPS